ncbi:MAG: transketolase family protein [Candidatus Omnitrophica bacterium]|nr:transketolase family protein [Candidatus Omnitrophota bacterium]
MEKKLGKATRDAYGQALVEIGKKNPQVVVLDADLSKSTKTADFGKAFPDRFFNVGIQEANLVGVASGLAASGKIPFISSFACFLICKGFDQLRMGVSFSELNVRVVASHGGISVGEDGASQMSIEDIALTTTLPHFAVMIPADEVSTRALVEQSVSYPGPIFMRTGRPKAPLIYDPNQKFEIGKAIRIREGRQVSLIATGLLVFEALQAAEELAQQGISASVIDVHTIKPLDAKLLVEEAQKTGHIVVCEEHQIWGGLGSAVSRVLAERHAACPMEFIAIQDTYAESGQPDELFEKYGLTSKHIVRAANKVLGQM